MLSSKGMRHGAFGRLRAGLGLGLLLGASLGLGGCTLTPVYGDGSGAGGPLALHYAEPRSRLEQVIYQDLRLRLGPDGGPNAPGLTVTAVPETRTITRTQTANPLWTQEVTVVATAYLFSPPPAEELLATITRSGRASYTTASQVVANDAAAVEAQERAARAAGDALRLALYATAAGSL